MDLIATVKDEFARVTKRQKLFHSISPVVFDRFCEGIVEALIRIQLDNNGVLEAKSVLTELRLKLDSLLPIIQLQGSQKEMNFTLSKFERVLEKSYHPDISQTCRSIDFNTHLMNKMLVHYLYQQGLFEVGDCLVKEADVELENEVISQLVEVYKLTESMKLKNIQPAMRWISANRERLEKNGSKLELELVSLEYCDMLRDGKHYDAWKYARTYFPKYGSLQMEEITKLVGALIWAGKLDKSPYAEIVSRSWKKVTKELIKRYYHVMDQPGNSLLAVALSAGLESLPKLLKLVEVMSLNKQEWQAMNKQFPFSLEMGNEFEFHSSFVCPVSLDESSEENPPMMMPCGHVFCKQSITRLTNNFGLKCPYCSTQTTASACRQLYF